MANLPMSMNSADSVGIFNSARARLGFGISFCVLAIEGMTAALIAYELWGLPRYGSAFVVDADRFEKFMVRSTVVVAVSGSVVCLLVAFIITYFFQVPFWLELLLYSRASVFLWGTIPYFSLPAHRLLGPAGEQEQVDEQFLMPDTRLATRNISGTRVYVVGLGEASKPSWLQLRSAVEEGRLTEDWAKWRATTGVHSPIAGSLISRPPSNSEKIKISTVLLYGLLAFCFGFVYGTWQRTWNAAKASHVDTPAFVLDLCESDECLEFFSTKGWLKTGSDAVTTIELNGQFVRVMASSVGNSFEGFEATHVVSIVRRDQNAVTFAVPKGLEDSLPSVLKELLDGDQTASESAPTIVETPVSSK